MPAPRHRSRTYRRVFRRTPGGKTVLHYRRRKAARPQCAPCGAQLHGMVRGVPRALRAAPKTARRPQRPYGGQLCSRCARRKIITKARTA